MYIVDLVQKKSILLCIIPAHPVQVPGNLRIWTNRKLHVGYEATNGELQ